MGRQEQRRAAREEREARERAEAQKRERRRRLTLGLAALVGVLVVAVAAVTLLGRGGDEADASVPPPRITELEPAARAAGCTLRTTRSEGNEHVETPVRYRSKPPVTGDHNIVPADDGVYTEPPRTEQLVHSLEHGRIVVQFRPSLSDDAKARLQALHDEDPYHMILTPDASNMPFEVAATSWTAPGGPTESRNNERGVVLGCERMNDQVFDAIRAMKTRYRDRSPEFVP